MNMAKKIMETIKEIPDLFGYVFGNAPRTATPPPSDISLGKKTEKKEEKEDGTGDDAADDEDPPKTLCKR